MIRETIPNSVYNMDVFDVIKVMPDKSIDLVMTDPPYGTNFQYGRFNKEILNDQDESINYAFIEAIIPKMKDNTSMYLFCNWKFIGPISEFAKEAGLKYAGLICLTKFKMMFGFPFRSKHEFILVFEKGDAEYYTKSFANVIKMPRVDHTKNLLSHPHEKHTDVLRKILLHSSEPGDLVFDGFLGSFASVISCIQEGRKYIGAELDKTHFDRGVRRIKEYNNQGKLF
jgi:site-specific DNA-methyltransferase (adenine-specific)